MKSIKILPLQKSVKADAVIPGSKSYTNRALLMAAMTQNSVKIINPLISDDTKAMIDCLEKLGIKILRGSNCLEVVNDITSIEDRSYDLDANLSGTTIRFMLALAAIIPGVKTLCGKEGLNKRPISELVEGLRQLGAKIEYLGKEGCPPVRILSSRLSPGIVRMNGVVSSQYFSAILMIAPLIGKVTIEVIGDQISKPYIDMTMDTMKYFGVTASNEAEAYKKYTVPDNQKYNISEYTVEGDVSSASYFFATAALTGSTLTLKNMNPNSVQGDMKFLKILERMRNKVIYGNNEVKIAGKGIIQPVEVDMEDCPDQVQTLAVLASFANGVTKISGIRSLRVKETERVIALERELSKMGIQTSSTTDTLTIIGGNPKPAKIDTYGDHRMAMSFAIAGTKLPGIEINDPKVVSKTFPDFWEKLNSIGVKTEPINMNIVLIGMRGSGKTTVAKLLSRKLSREYLELDEMLVEELGLSIPTIVKRHGWEYFRNKESEIAKKVAKRQDKIVSAGGGVVLKSENIEALKRNGILIYLKASVKTLLQRIGNDPNRPPLIDKKTRKEEVEELLISRKKLYEQAADMIIATDNLGVNEVADQIILQLGRENI